MPHAGVLWATNEYRRPGLLSKRSATESMAPNIAFDLSIARHSGPAGHFLRQLYNIRLAQLSIVLGNRLIELLSGDKTWSRKTSSI